MEPVERGQPRQPPRAKRRGAVRRREVPVLAFSGPSGVGKTTLLVQLIPELVARGLTVTALKHSGHDHPFDRPGKDSARLRQAGAIAVALQGRGELAYFGPPVAGIGELVRLLPPADLVLAESFKNEPMPRIEVHRSDVEPAFLCASDPHVIAVVSDVEPPRALPWFTADEVEALGEFVARFALSSRRQRSRARATERARTEREPRQRGRKARPRQRA